MNTLKLNPLPVSLDYPISHSCNNLSGNNSTYTCLPMGAENGIIAISNPADGLTTTTWNVHFNNPVKLHKGKSSLDSLRNFRILFIKSPGNCFLKKIGDHYQFSRLTTKSILLVSDGVNIDFEVLPDLPLKLIDIKICDFWIKERLKINKLHFPGRWNQLLSTYPTIILHELCSDLNGIFIQELFESLISGKEDDPTNEELIINLISVFLEKALGRPTFNIDNNYKHLPESLATVITILKTNLYGHLPKLDAIAREVAVSESTLKRQFKDAFGKNIYSFYLDLKMDLAKHMIQETGLTVNEVALKLNYENASNFIDIFKKKHGYSPGSIKKNKPALNQDE